MFGIASRKHVEAINEVIHCALKQSDLAKARLDAIAVTFGPGLVGALLVGVSAAKALAYGLSVPLIGVHHIEGHISANYIQYKELEPPFVCLIVSGGHTQIVHVKDYGSYDLVGETMDDAAGEAFDKVARVLGLGYPGGPAVDRIARHGNPNAIHFPRAGIKDRPFDFSFSGLKTAVIIIFTIWNRRAKPIPQRMAASFQAVMDVLVEKTIASANMRETGKIVMAAVLRPIHT